jgi:hypothetical protein
MAKYTKTYTGLTKHLYTPVSTYLATLGVFPLASIDGHTDPPPRLRPSHRHPRVACYRLDTHRRTFLRLTPKTRTCGVSDRTRSFNVVRSKSNHTRSRGGRITHCSIVRFWNRFPINLSTGIHPLCTEGRACRGCLHLRVRVEDD